MAAAIVWSPKHSPHREKGRFDVIISDAFSYLVDTSGKKIGWPLQPRWECIRLHRRLEDRSAPAWPVVLAVPLVMCLGKFLHPASSGVKQNPVALPGSDYSGSDILQLLIGT